MDSTFLGNQLLLFFACTVDIGFGGKTAASHAPRIHVAQISIINILES